MARSIALRANLHPNFARPSNALFNPRRRAHSTLVRKLVFQALRLLSSAATGLGDGSRKRDGTLTAGANILIDFDDGYRWSSLTNRDFNALPDSGLVDFLHAKTGLPVMRAQTERDLPTLVY
jgi:hypothetical protein